MTVLAEPLDGLTVLERGWLSSNNVLVHAAPGETGALLIDSSHVNHAAQTLALVRHALAGRPLVGIANTHLHSDHCGGNATLQRAFGASLAIPPGLAAAVERWDVDALGFATMGQRIERFSHQSLTWPGSVVRAGGRDWEILATGGHDPHMLMWFDRARGVLLSADALWENGFGLLFPEIVGESGFDEQAAVLDTIASLPVRVVIPGHGAPFGDVASALARARQRLEAMRREPARHARHAMKVVIKYHLMEEREKPIAALLAWAETTSLVQELWQRFAPAGFTRVAQWVEQAANELVAAGALARRGDLLLDT